MPIPNHKNLISILSSFRENATERAGLSLFSRDGKYRAISDALSEEVISQKEEQVNIDYASKLSNASGKALDEIGDKLGLPRIRSLHAKVDSTERSLAFYVESGNFGAINSGSSISLPATVRISSNANSNELGTSVDYQLTQAYTLTSSSSIQYVSARAVNIGTASNVGQSVLRQHNFTGYTDSANNTLKVLNFYPIINGVDDEPDDLYRYRLANHYNRMIANNDTKMKLGALEIPGIVNSRVEPGYFGIGTAGVFALGPENQSNTRLINTLQQRLDAYKIPAGEYIATPATEVTFDFELQIVPVRSLTNRQLLRLKAEINKAFLAYFRNLSLGSVVDLELLISQTQKKIQSFASFAQRGGDRRYKKVYVRKSFAGGPTDEKSRVIANTYSLANDEFASLGTLDIEVV